MKPRYAPQGKRLLVGLLWLAGGLSLLLGIIGIFLPVMPTVPFVLLTAACWGRASPRFHAWLCNHRYFGPIVVNWEQNRAVSRRNKYIAWFMMGCSCVMLLFWFPERWWVAAATATVCLSVGVWMAKLPEA